MSKKYQSHIIAFVGTIIALILVFLLLWFLHLKYVKPVEDEGIEITLGEVEEGGGIPDYAQASPEPKVRVSASRPAASRSSSNDLIAQEQEESVVVNKPTETPEEPQIDPELIRQQQEREEQERLAKEKAEKKRQEQEQKKKKKKAQDLGGLFGNTDSPDGSNGDPGDEGKGDKGNPLGKGSVSANPPEVAVPNRQCLSLVKPKGQFPQSGKVVLKITVDEQGKVLPSVGSGTTISDQATINAAKKAAMSTKFSAGERATGTITYVFK